MLQGKEYFENGVLNFGLEQEQTGMFGFEPLYGDGTYRTDFGPTAAHNGKIFANSDRNVSIAFTRMTAARFPESPGKHELYLYRQAQYLRVHADFLEEVCQLYSPHFKSYLGMYLEAKLHHADPHEKRLLRIQAWEELHVHGIYKTDMGAFDELWLEVVLYKMKKNEIAKPSTPDKPEQPRMIGDLGVAASLQGFRLTHYLKCAMAAEPIIINGGSLHFIKTPDPWVLTQVFNQMNDPDGRFYFCYFSDDACLSIRHDGKIYRYNLDISKCDASHSDELFTALEKIIVEEHRHDMEILTRQCGLPIEVRSTIKSYLKVRLQANRRLLFSGSTITTCINNLANILIGHAISRCDFQGDSKTLVEAAAKVGYIIKCDVCEIIEDVQFLKNSPVFDTTGTLRPLLNPGVLLRLSGTCKGDLPGRGDLRQRGLDMQAGLLKGAYPFSNFRLLDNMRANAGTSNAKIDAIVCNTLKYKTADPLASEKYPQYLVSSEAMWLRYRLDSSEIYSIEELFGNMGYGHSMADSGLDKVLDKDYGLCTTRI